ncbi:histidine phosphatase family protein [Nocardia harenae]|uniref:histidine phosphatase family protein n=1 Tax=Nocardia harenae TaxID=358707 RepID=UPI000834F0C4|nr:histidine phosphatase family protein [Nocardia harenae]
MAGMVRLDLVSHGITGALRAGLFPDDEPLVDSWAAEPIARPPAVVLSGPERRTRQTARLLGVRAEVDPALRDLDAGEWRGLDMGELPPEQLHAWLTDPAFDGHGGESVVAVLARVGEWMRGVAAAGEPVLAVTHPAVVRAAVAVALAAPPPAFWRVDVPPGSRTRLHFRGAWTLRLPV